MNIVFWRLVFANCKVFADRPSFGFDSIVKFVIFGFIMPRAPVVQVTLNTVFHLDMHPKFKNDKFITRKHLFMQLLKLSTPIIIS